MVMSKAAIYCRVSTPGQASDEKTSLATQERECRLRAADDGLQVVEHYVVLDASTSSEENEYRDKVQYLLAGARKGAFDVLLMDLVDRTGRSGIAEFFDLVNSFLRVGVTPLWATDRSIDLSTQVGQFLAASKALVAHEEKEAIVRRFRRGKQGRLSQGLLLRGYCPYGYRWADSAHTQYEPDPLAAPIVQRIFAELAHGGTATQIVKVLNAERILTPGEARGRDRSRFKGKPPQWSLRVLLYLVRNPIYKGQRAHNRFAMVKRDRQQRRERNLKTSHSITERDNADWALISVPPLVDAEMFEQANRQLAHNAWSVKRPPKRYTTADVLLYGGFVRCAHCGRAVVVTDPRQRWSYACARKKQDADGHRCPGVAISARIVDRFVWHQACMLIRDPDYLKARLHESEDVWSPQAQIDHYEQLIADLDMKDEAIAHELVRLASSSNMQHIRAILERDAAHHAEMRVGYERKLADAQRDAARQRIQEERMRTFATWAQHQQDSLDDLTAEQKREILLSVMHPTIFIARKDSEEPRLSVVFSVTEEAAARLTPGVLFTTLQGQTPQGDSYVVTVADDSDGTRLADEELDLTDVIAVERDSSQITLFL